MTVFGVSMVRDEVDIVEHTLRRLADQVDHLIVADNASTDGTRELLDELARDLPLTVLDDPEVGYWQARKMTDLARRSAERGATWVVPFDADEVWAARRARTIGAQLAELDRHILVAQAFLFDHVPSAEDPDEASPIARIGWRRIAPAPLRKVAVRARLDVQIHQGNHGASFGGVRHAPAVADLLEVRHFPYRSPEQMVRKALQGAEAYEATDLPQDAGAHWRGYARIVREQGPEALHAVFREWFWAAAPSEAPDLVFDPA